jgi:hypothetical protein
MPAEQSSNESAIAPVGAASEVTASGARHRAPAKAMVALVGQDLQFFGSPAPRSAQPAVSPLQLTHRNLK